MKRWIILFSVVIALVLGIAAAVVPVSRHFGWIVPSGKSTISADHFVDGYGVNGVGVADNAVSPTNFRSSDSAKVAAALQSAGIPAGFSVVVRNLADGQVLDSVQGDAPVRPASSMKLMTTTSLVDKVGADHRFTTKVVSEPDGSITIVGGGDPLLSSATSAYTYGAPIPATSAELAKQTADALKTKGTTSVALNYDDSLFSGPTRHPDWVADDMSDVNDISALMIDEGSHSATPSATAATTFAAQLGANGISVQGAPSARTADETATKLASVDSLPLSQIVDECLRHSDNTIAETLFRHLAIAYGQPATFDGGAKALTQAMQHLGVWADADKLHDGSGLDENDRLTASTLSQVIVLAAGRSDLRSVLAGLPVAGATGTLAEDSRFSAENSQAGTGWVRAKTGTLTDANALVGYTPTADGGMVAFSLVSNGINTQARPQLDHLAASLTGCACGS